MIQILYHDLVLLFCFGLCLYIFEDKSKKQKKKTMYPKLSKSRYNVESVLELIRFVLMLLLQLAKSRDVKSLLKWVYYFFGELYFG